MPYYKFPALWPNTFYLYSKNFPQFKTNTKIFKYQGYNTWWTNWYLSGIKEYFLLLNIKNYYDFNIEESMTLIAFGEEWAPRNNPSKTWYSFEEQLKIIQDIEELWITPRINYD